MVWLAWLLVVGEIVVIIVSLFSITLLLKPQKLSKKAQKELYDKVRPAAFKIKITFQMLIGIGLAVLVIFKFSHHLTDFSLGTKIAPNSNAQDVLSVYVFNRPTLDIVGLALAYSTAIELAYALFTPGPDEAVEPLILGLAAVILLVTSHIGAITFDNASGVVLLVLALVILFILRYFFIEEKGWLHLLEGKNTAKGHSSASSKLQSQEPPKDNGMSNASSPNSTQT